jgi:hypothetical protein
MCVNFSLPNIKNLFDFFPIETFKYSILYIIIKRDIFYISSKMSDFRNSHRILVEESRCSTTFDGSLHSKMSTINFDQDFWDMLNYKRRRNTIKWFSAVLDKLVRKDVNSIRNYLNRRDDF